MPTTALRTADLLLGAVLAIASLPQVWMAGIAFTELAWRTPSGISFLDYQACAWSQCAFILSHLWLGWEARAVRMPPQARVRTGMVILLGGEIGWVWLVVSWLAVRGWGVVLF
jgi:hypothetical protein